MIDDKLQLELVPYGSVSFSTHGFTRAVLAPHFDRILSTIAAVPRQYVLFCGVVFKPLLRAHVTRWHEFHLRKSDGTLERQRSFFGNLLLPHKGGFIRAGLAQSWARQGIPHGRIRRGGSIALRGPCSAMSIHGRRGRRSVLAGIPLAPRARSIPSHVALIERLLCLERITGRAKDDLLTVGARCAEFASWLHQDSGNKEKATYWVDRALGWAQEAGNPLVVSYVLTRKGNQVAAQRDAAGAIRLAQAAQRERHRLTARALAVALQQEALGHALAGNEVASQRRLDDALSLAVQSQRDQEVGPGRYCTPGYVEIQRATCWTTLGKPKRGIDLFERELARLPLVHRRDRGVYLARLSIAYEANGDRDAARAKAQDALMIAQATGSGRIITELQPLQGTLARREPLPDASQLLKALGIST